MKKIPLYADNLWCLAAGEAWIINRWTLKDGTSVSFGDIVAEVESALCSCEVVCPYTGTLRQCLEEGWAVTRGNPIAQIEASAEEYEDYLRTGGKIDFSVSLGPAELERLEFLRGDLSREAFVAELVREGLCKR